MCGQIITEIEHDGLSIEFLDYNFPSSGSGAAADQRWVKLAPTKREHELTYTIKLV